MKNLWVQINSLFSHGSSLKDQIDFDSSNVFQGQQDPEFLK